MLRTSLAAAVGAIIGALCIATIRERVQDQLWSPVEATSLGLVALLAFLLVLLGMALRNPRTIHVAQQVQGTAAPPRDRVTGRFKSADGVR